LLGRKFYGKNKMEQQFDLPQIKEKRRSKKQGLN